MQVVRIRLLAIGSLQQEVVRGQCLVAKPVGLYSSHTRETVASFAHRGGARCWRRTSWKAASGSDRKRGLRMGRPVRRRARDVSPPLEASEPSTSQAASGLFSWWTRAPARSGRLVPLEYRREPPEAVTKTPDERVRPSPECCSQSLESRERSGLTISPA